MGLRLNWCLLRAKILLNYVEFTSQSGRGRLGKPEENYVVRLEEKPVTLSSHLSMNDICASLPRDDEDDDDCVSGDKMKIEMEHCRVYFFENCLQRI